MLSSPKYFIAVLGDPDPPKKDTVESGIYHPDVRFAPFPIRPGDFLLFYCTSSYAKYSMKSPGIGVVIENNDQNIIYRYIAFEKEIPKKEIEVNLNQEEKKSFKNIWMSSQWLKELSKTSFTKCIENKQFSFK